MKYVVMGNAPAIDRFIRSHNLSASQTRTVHREADAWRALAGVNARQTTVVVVSGGLAIMTPGIAARLGRLRADGGHVEIDGDK